MIRINELARELEVPSRAIIEALPDLGITDKKTHSSSLEEDVVRLLRRHFGHDVADEPAPVAPKPEPPAVAPVQAAAKTPPAAVEPPRAVAEEPASAPKTEPSPESAAARPASPPSPLRPPLAGGGAPISPPIAAKPISAPIRPAPVAPPVRPGQVLSGPRQPLPADVVKPPAPPVAPRLPLIARPSAPPVARPAAPTVVAPATPAPASPAPPPAAVAPGSPIARPAPPPRPPQAVVAPGSPIVPQRPMMPQAPRPPQTPMAPRPQGLAGQPAQRPVVPPNPALLARIQQQPRPGVSAPIRPGVPIAPRPGAPMPGQPQFRQPIRPGQPMGPRPGGPGFAARGGPPGRAGRPMHPTTPLRPEAMVVPTEAGRRHATKPKVQREIEEQEGRLHMRSRREESIQAVNKEITISEGITVKEFAEKLGLKVNVIIQKLLGRKIFATINQHMDLKLAEELAREVGAAANRMSYEEEASWDIEMSESADDQVQRAPVVTIMGHVDHGKTSLLDAIRLANVAEGEAGGITQHIGAYQTFHAGRKVVFIDTPGHEAFTRMRARGAKVTDIVIVVVAADDGVMPQTIEAIDHARAAGVPMIVAINKIDKPDANLERIKQQLADRNVLAEDWGGDVTMVPVSAKAKQNLDLLLEMVLLTADMKNLRANPSRPAIGNVLEAQLDRGRGPVATILVRNGTLRVGDFFICGSVFGKVRAMYDDRGNQIREAEPATPVEVLGMDTLPEVGDAVQVVTDVAKARQIVEFRESRTREQSLAKSAARLGLEAFHERLKEGETKDLNLIIKADVGGSAEVIADTLQKLSNEKVRIRVLHTGVGAITESDVLLASTSEAIIIGFNVRPERTAVATAEREKIDIRLHTIIYEVVDEIKKAMSGLLEPVFKESIQGRVEVREVFRITKVGSVAGCFVQEGMITRHSQVRLLRDNIVVHTGKVDTLKRFKNDVSEVKQGFECGVAIAGYNDIKPGDIIEAFVTEKVAQEMFA